MTPFGVVEALDVVEHIGLGLVPCPVCFARGSLRLQRREEALHRCIVPDVARAAHAAGHAVVGDEALELFTGVLAAAIGMMQQRIGLCPVARSPSQRRLLRHPDVPATCSAVHAVVLLPSLQSPSIIEQKGGAGPRRISIS